MTDTFVAEPVPADALAARVKVVDADAHLIEPPDLWTSRVSVAKWGDLVPHVRWDETSQQDSWFFGDSRIIGSATCAMAGWDQFPPSWPKHLSDVDPATWDAEKRLKRMDEDGVYAQVLYPNVAGFGAGHFTNVKHPDLTLLLVQAYNDFLAEYSSIAPDRYIAIAAVPFWDLDASVKEIRRAKELGHRGIMFGQQPDFWGAPDLTDRHWDPVWATAQELEMPVNFHVASGDSSAAWGGNPQNGPSANFAIPSISFFVDNSRAITRLIFGGICHRFPNLDFVSVESGVGWLPFAVDAMDWMWKNCGVGVEHPEYDLLPSEYFRRQIYGCFWFEDEPLRAAVEHMGPDNFLYETDFPHPTSMSPGPASAAVEPWRYVEDVVGSFPEETARKLLHDNAARVYGLT